MGEYLKKRARRKRVRAELDRVDESRRQALIIHYSCESFYGKEDGYSPRVTSIAVRNFQTAQTQSFSIHKIAELDGVSPDKISENYDEPERKMLNEFFDYLRTLPAHHFVHWNMRDINFGFQAIEQRYRVLGGDPIVVDDNYKFDLARALVTLYGKNYAPHGDAGRMHSIMKLNKITDRDALTGAEEAAAFDNAEYVKLHQSTLRKVDIISNILERTIDKEIKVASTFFDRTDYHPAALIEYVKEHWVWSTVVIFGVVFAFIGRISGFF